MNYIIIGVVRWLQGGPWEGRPGSQIIPHVRSGRLTLPEVLGVHCGWIIVLVLVVVMHVYMNYTKHGYEIAVIGDSMNTARYAGMNVGHVMMRTMFLSGAISGLVGFIVASGANTTLYDGVADGVGFTSITVAWLSQLNAFAMIVISALLAIIWPRALRRFRPAMAGACLDLRHHYRHPALLYAGLRVLHQLPT